MNAKKLKALRSDATRLRDVLVAERNGLPAAIAREQAELLEKLGPHATQEALSHRAAELRAQATQPYTLAAIELLAARDEVRAHRTYLQDRARLLRRRPAPFPEVPVGDYVGTAESTRAIVDGLRAVYEALTAQTFQAALSRHTPEDLVALATDAATTRDYDAFAAIDRELAGRGPEALDARAQMRPLKDALPLPDEDEAAVADATAYLAAANEVAEGLEALRTGTETGVVLEESIRLATEHGPEDYAALRAAQRASRDGSTAPRIPVTISHNPAA